MERKKDFVNFFSSQARSTSSEVFKQGAQNSWGAQSLSRSECGQGNQKIVFTTSTNTWNLKKTLVKDISMSF